MRGSAPVETISLSYDILTPVLSVNVHSDALTEVTC